MIPLPFRLIGSFLWCGLLLGTSACNPAPAPRSDTLVIAAASDLKYALDEIIDHFTDQHPQWRVEVVYGSSGLFYAQLMNRAPFDLFLSADMDYPRKLAHAGFANPDDLFHYAIGRIVVWTLNDSPIDAPSLQSESLLHPSATTVAIANPRHAPYGVAAVAALRDLELYEHVAPRLVYGENIAQTAQFIESGAASIGIIALSLALAPALHSKGHYWEIPLEHFPRMDQGGILLPWAAPREAAVAFREHLLGPAGREILRAYGFYLPEER
ncbi:MAG TPA: molybdate ABC transporter substrate-binding protein [Kiritimatiellia bacterium]|nr:molybdate ABC transporter substrate-binding protein [Kiritimatiellia bacterium]